MPDRADRRIRFAKLGQPWSREVAPGVFRLGTTYAGWYAVEEGGAYTFIDTGLAGYWEQMAGFLASRNAALSAVKAVVLTHHHGRPPRQCRAAQDAGSRDSAGAPG